MESLGNDTGLKGRTIGKVVGEGGWLIHKRRGWPDRGRGLRAKVKSLRERSYPKNKNNN